MNETTYALGHSPAEIQRLKNQGAMLRPITERLLRNAGIEAGMRVLDLGCGAGDVSVLAAELVGPEGSVVGIDRSQEVLNVAKERAREGGSLDPQGHRYVVWPRQAGSATILCSQ